MRLPWLFPDQVRMFPPSASALKQPNGLLAAGGDLSPARLLHAYRKGIFPWFNPGEPILWWTPDPRLVLFPEELVLTPRDARWLRNCSWTLRADTNFAQVLAGCAQPRAAQDGTWLGHAMQHAYQQLHELGYAHSVEVYEGKELIAGIYGLALGQVFFGESMFGTRSNASKTALFALATGLRELGFALLDCQVRSEHLVSRGAREISRADFELLLMQNVAATPLASATKTKLEQPGLWNQAWPLGLACDLQSF